MLKSKDKIKVLIADKTNLCGTKYLPENKFYIEYNINLSNSEILKKYGDFDVLVIRSVRKIGKDFLEKCNFKMIASCTKGLDHVDLKAADKCNIKIINSETGNVVSAAEHTFGLILEISKKINFSDKLVRKNKFSFYDYKRMELRGKKIGIIGFGKVGSRVAKYADAFEMVVYANDIDIKVRKNNPKYEFKPLNYILRNSDIVTVHIPLNGGNVNFISGEKMKLLTDNTIFINTSRGEVIEEKALIKLLQAQKIYYAGLDVFKNEPKIDKMFYKLENVVLTNHIAGKTYESSKYISKDIFMQVKNHFS